MKRYLKIAAMALVWIISSGKSCNDNDEHFAVREEARVQATKDSVVSAFSTDSLAPATLRAFELTAQGKLADFADYLHILNDSAAKPAFKTKTREMIGELFISGEVHLRFPQRGCPDLKDISLAEILKPGSKQLHTELLFDSVGVKKPLKMENDTLCSGQLIFTKQNTLPVVKYQNPGKSLVNLIDIYAVKRQKVFGTDTLKVWKVLLGDFH